MPDFTGNARFYLQPGAAKVPISWGFAASSSASENDGSIPYGTAVAAAEVVISDSEGADKTTELLDTSATADGDVVSATLRYPPAGVTGSGIYTAEVRVTLDTGAVIPFDCRRIYCGDRSGA